MCLASTDCIHVLTAQAYRESAIQAKETEPMSARYSHAYSLGFEISSCQFDGEDVSGSLLRRAIISRLNKLTDSELTEACGAPFDTHEVE